MKLNNITSLTLGLLLTSMSLVPTLGVAQSGGKSPSQNAGSMKMEPIKSTAFKGIEANKGTVSFNMVNGVPTLEVSKDFVVPPSPAPHWQIIDIEGNVFLLKQFRIAGNKTNSKITLPKNIKSVAKVQVWCSFAEVNLGEASFAKPIMIKTPGM